MPVRKRAAAHRRPGGARLPAARVSSPGSPLMQHEDEGQELMGLYVICALQPKPRLPPSNSATTEPSLAGLLMLVCLYPSGGHAAAPAADRGDRGAGRDGLREPGTAVAPLASAAPGYRGNVEGAWSRITPTRCWWWRSRRPAWRRVHATRRPAERGRGLMRSRAVDWPFRRRCMHEDQEERRARRRGGHAHAQGMSRRERCCHEHEARRARR